MNIFKRAVGFFKKIIHGGSPIKIKYNETEWDTQFEKGNWDFLLREHENIILVSNIINSLASKQVNKLKILDVGCGNGALAVKLDQATVDYYGTDISRAGVDAAKKNVPWGTFTQSNMDVDVPFSEEQFDVIIFCEVLVYVDYERVLERYAERLQPEGLFVVSLYDTWRTKLILRQLIRSIDIVKKVFVKNQTRNVCWNILVGRYQK